MKRAFNMKYIAFFHIFEVLLLKKTKENFFGKGEFNFNP